MNKGKVILIALVAVLCASGLFFYFSSANKITEKEKWILKEVYTQAMDSAFALDSSLSSEKLSLLPEPITQGDATLYSLLYYPNLHTIICTVDEPVQFGGRISPYLVTPDGRGFSGWYSSSLTQFGIMKIAFEEITPYAEIAYLDLVDDSTISGAYDPNAQNTSRVRFTVSLGKLVTAGNSSENASGQADSANA